MLTFILIQLILSLLICITCFTIHFRQHFRLQCCNKHYRKPELIKKLSGKFSSHNNDDSLPPTSDYPKLQSRGSLFSRETWDNPEVRVIVYIHTIIT